MPIIGEKLYKKVLLPTEGAWVKLLTNPSPDLWDKLQETEDDKKGMAMLFAGIITEWNFCKADGTIAEITMENVGAALSAFDIAKITTELGMKDMLLSEAKKNKSTNTLSEKVATEPLPNTSLSSTENNSI